MPTPTAQIYAGRPIPNCNLQVPRLPQQRTGQKTVGLCRCYQRGFECRRPAGSLRKLRPPRGSGGLPFSVTGRDFLLSLDHRLRTGDAWNANHPSRYRENVCRAQPCFALVTAWHPEPNGFAAERHCRAPGEMSDCLWPAAHCRVAHSREDYRAQHEGRAAARASVARCGSCEDSPPTADAVG